jgi:site-specific DNA recombinase
MLILGTRARKEGYGFAFADYEDSRPHQFHEEELVQEIYRLREQKQKAQLENSGRDELRKRITDMSTFLREQPTAITEYNEPLVRRLIEKVTVFADKFTVEFKSGVTVDVERWI